MNAFGVQITPLRIFWNFLSLNIWTHRVQKKNKVLRRSRPFRMGGALKFKMKCLKNYLSVIDKSVVEKATKILFHWGTSCSKIITLCSPNKNIFFKCWAVYQCDHIFRCPSKNVCTGEQFAGNSLPTVFPF